MTSIDNKPLCCVHGGESLPPTGLSNCSFDHHTACVLQFGYSPLNRASVEGHTGVVTVLVEAKANVDLQNTVMVMGWMRGLISCDTRLRGDLRGGQA